jgi:hypothetical protein
MHQLSKLARLPFGFRPLAVAACAGEISGGGGLKGGRMLELGGKPHGDALGSSSFGDTRTSYGHLEFRTAAAPGITA